MLAGLLGAGIFAAVMSSLDSQVLAMGTMFTQDVVRHYAGGRRHGDDHMSDRRQIRAGRLFVIAILLLTYLLSLVAETSIFGLAIWSFTGFASLFPIVVAALFWRRATASGAIAAIFTVAALWIYFFSNSWRVPGYTIGDSGVMPVAVIFAASCVAMVVASLLSKPPAKEVLARFFPEVR